MSAAVAVDDAAESIPSPADTLNNLERLILAQAVYELGSDAWTSVSSILSQHPLILHAKRDNATFSPSACQNIYHHLLRIVGLDSAEPEKQPRNAHSNNLKLAQRMYQARVLELKQLILAEEARFNSVAAEIEAIRAGKWDSEIEKDFAVDETTSDKLASSPQSERVSAIEGPGSDLTGVSDSSSSVPQVQVAHGAKRTGRNLAIPDSLPRATTPPSTHEGDIPPSIAPKLSPVPSLVGTDYVDEHIDLGSPQLRHESPDPLDIITPAEEDRYAIPSPSQPFESSDGTVSAEPEHSSVVELPEMADVYEDQPLETSEIMERSEAEVEIESDEPAAVSISNPVEGETSVEDRPDMTRKEDASIRPMSEPSVVQAVGSPLSLGGTTTSIDCTRKTESEAELHPAEATGMVEVKEEGQLDESRPDETQVKQDDEMEIEHENGHEAVSPVAEQSRRDRPARRRGRPAGADSQTSKKFQTVITMVHSQISQHRNGNIFHNPIKTSEAPDYYDIVRRPMDLKTIKARIREGQIASSDEFQRDVYLMFANSLMYNRPGSDIFNMAEEMMLESETQINTFRQTEGIIKGSHR
ncbi:hypothetical protein BJV77DRAFT_975101 [Russula vinacea]|nr:hypothetical protein BJV77DRAFT_975101 [Russula vinacea]